VRLRPLALEAPALELAERGIPVVAFPQSNSRMVPASERLHAAIVEKRLQHPDDPALNAHVRAAIARDTPRGWRIDKLKSRDNIDAVVAMAMAVEAAENKPAPVELLGWL
jgi:phage terminase large subunit-like protein